MVVVDASVVERAQAWARLDPHQATKTLVETLIRKATNENNNEANQELIRLFPSRRIQFGTAGLRSDMSPGPLGMNVLVIIQTAQGLARYCQSQQHSNNNKVVIGYDHRANPSLQLSSLLFALYSVLVLEAAGMKAVLLDGFVHTPLVAFSTRHLNAQAGIMITASHNPKTDAGYKLYWNDGCQIRPPMDEGIQSCILQNLQPWMDYGKLLSSLQTESMDVCCGLSHPQLTRDVTREYFHAIQNSGLVTGQASLLLQTAHFTPPKFAYTAMHGVGREFAVKVFEVFGLPQFHSVPSQELPDANFTTVVFPNPEEEGALNLSKEFAVEHDCDVVLANDPDADRLAVAERDRQTGTWTVFTGDQIGTMLGYWLWEQVGKKCEKVRMACVVDEMFRNESSHTLCYILYYEQPVAMCASTVSSKMLAEIARVEGFHFEETLTGFKWIGSRAEALSREGYKSLFCYEEAIGYCCGDVVHDKDGITALGVFAEVSCNVYNKGLSLAQHMQSLYDKYGEFVSNNGYYFCYDPTVVTKIMRDMQNNGEYMTKVGPYEVESIRDLWVPGYDSTTPDKRPTLPTSKSSPMLTIRFKNGCVAQFRGSGTEPKFKYYIELRGEPGVSRDAVTEALSEMSAVILEELLHPEANGLVHSSSS